ncbi:d-protein [Lasallia pustulata]|uniref:D-protein n=1 Tax=Lasallia pustulata TaxID=136370 RepID=A0A1W5D2E3_9LECA|nr:d-protein [Lasallia pustulata]
MALLVEEGKVTWNTLVKDILSDFKFANGRTSTEGSPLKQVNHLMSAKVPMNQPTLRETSYGFGWALVQLPGTMGDIGCNPPLMPHGMPVLGKGAPSRLVIYYQGSLPGALAAVNLIPDTETAIVVLTNSMFLNDTPDWVGQLVLEELLEVPERNDYVKAAEASVAEAAKWYPATVGELQRARINDTSPRSLEDYAGTYWDEIHIFKIEVTLVEGTLYWAFPGLESEKFQLDHYEHDVFTWIQTRNELARRGRWVDQGAPFWQADFKVNDKVRLTS